MPGKKRQVLQSEHDSQDPSQGPSPHLAAVAVRPSRQSKVKALENQVWQRDAPKRKRKLSDATGDAVVERRPEQAQKKRRAEDETAGKPKQTKDSAGSKQLPTGKGRRPVLQRELLVDEDVSAEKRVPLPPKVVISAAKQQSRPVKTAGHHAPASSGKKPVPKALEPEPTDDNDDSNGVGIESDAQSDAVVSDDNEDLITLEKHPDRLRETMAREVPRWTANDRILASEDVVSGDEDFQDAQPLAVPRSLSRRSSEASHSSAALPSTPAASSDDDGDLSAAEDAQLDPKELFADDDKRSVASRDRAKAPIAPAAKGGRQADHSTQPPKMMSRREQAVEKERPRFKMASTTATISDRSIQAGSTSMAVQRQGRRTMETMAEWEKKWPSSTRLLYNSRIKINISAQSVGVQRVLKSSIEELITDFAFGTAVYPAEERISAQRSLVISVATRLAFKEIRARLREEWEYAKEFVEVGEHRVTLLRGGIKKTVIQVLASIYELKQGECRERVALLLEDLHYIYAGDVESKLDKKNPFTNKLITQLLAVHFFNGPRSIASQYSNLFKSTIPESPDEKEIPEAMLGIVCVAIYDGLGDWTTGTFTVASDFEVGNVEAEYLKVMDFLAEIKAKSVKMYHRIMYQVYKNVCDQRGGIANPNRKRGVAGALAQLEFDDE
ncbi:hypothetical protein EW026_g8087 [Hermanssonia centrifuga]|uniref:DUF6532 domain-containing protein n=1 Tax=Hermanssonia centrifuga TaxID=98765 RepID=A0A4S4K5J4_9APHY|nr:hypothetical protein EW026_g8087 [Hermanssonia centrifuga]